MKPQNPGSSLWITLAPLRISRLQERQNLLKGTFETLSIYVRSGGNGGREQG